MKILEKGLYKRWRSSVVAHQLNSSSGGGSDSDGDGDDGVMRPSQLIDLSFLGHLMAEKSEYLLPFCHYRLLSLCADKVVMIYLALLKDGQKTSGCYFQANGPGNQRNPYCTFLCTHTSHLHTYYTSPILTPCTVILHSLTCSPSHLIALQKSNNCVLILPPPKSFFIPCVPTKI